VETHQLSDLNEKVFIRVREEAPWLFLRDRRDLRNAHIRDEKSPTVL
jgi:predicted amidohydrolase